MTAHQTYAVTSVSEQAAHFFNEAASKSSELFSKFTNLEAIHDMVRTELTSAKPVEQVPLFSGFSMAGFAGNYQVANADHSEAFTPNGGGNSGRGPRTVG